MAEVKKIAVLTMVRNDEQFLKKWVEYYGKELGKEHLYVYFDGEDQQVPAFCKGVNTMLRKRAQGDVVATDRDRARFISSEAGRLMREHGYNMALGTDVDEFLIADPELGMGLAEFLSQLPDRPTYSGLGVDVGQGGPLEGAIDWHKPLLAQRSRGWLYARYTKATVITRPLVWGSGYHRVKGHNYHIVDGLYLFHLGGIDLKRLRERSSNPEDVGQGWSRHLKKRARTVLAVSDSRPLPWSPIVERVRRIQQLFRPVFAWNKPTTFGVKYIVTIPERFLSIL